MLHWCNEHTAEFDVMMRRAQHVEEMLDYLLLAQRALKNFEEASRKKVPTDADFQVLMCMQKAITYCECVKQIDELIKGELTLQQRTELVLEADQLYAKWIEVVAKLNSVLQDEAVSTPILDHLRNGPNTNELRTEHTRTAKEFMELCAEDGISDERKAKLAARMDELHARAKEIQHELGIDDETIEAEA